MNNFNALTHQFYSVSNQSHLEKHKKQLEVSSDEWAGFHQWRQLNRQVKKGAKSCKVFMICDKKVESSNGEKEKKKVLKALRVFNKGQTEQI